MNACTIIKDVPFRVYQDLWNYCCENSSYPQKIYLEYHGGLRGAVTIERMSGESKRYTEVLNKFMELYSKN